MINHRGKRFVAEISAIYTSKPGQIFCVISVLIEQDVDNTICVRCFEPFGLNNF